MRRTTTALRLPTSERLTLPRSSIVRARWRTELEASDCGSLSATDVNLSDLGAEAGLVE